MIPRFQLFYLLFLLIIILLLHIQLLAIPYTLPIESLDHSQYNIPKYIIRCLHKQSSILIYFQYKLIQCITLTDAGWELSLQWYLKLVDY